MLSSGEITAQLMPFILQIVKGISSVSVCPNSFLQVKFLPVFLYYCIGIVYVQNQNIKLVLLNVEQCCKIIKLELKLIGTHQNPGRKSIGKDNLIGLSLLKDESVNN